MRGHSLWWNVPRSCSNLLSCCSLTWRVFNLGFGSLCGWKDLVDSKSIEFIHLLSFLQPAGTWKWCSESWEVESRSISSSASRCLRKNLWRVRMQQMHGIHLTHPQNNQATISPGLEGASAGKYLALAPSMLQLRPGKHHTASEVFPGRSGQMPLTSFIINGATNTSLCHCTLKESLSKSKTLYAKNPSLCHCMLFEAWRLSTGSHDPSWTPSGPPIQRYSEDTFPMRHTGHCQNCTTCSGSQIWWLRGEETWPGSIA